MAQLQLCLLYRPDNAEPIVLGAILDHGLLREAARVAVQEARAMTGVVDSEEADVVLREAEKQRGLLLCRVLRRLVPEAFDQRPQTIM